MTKARTRCHMLVPLACLPLTWVLVPAAVISDESAFEMCRGSYEQGLRATQCMNPTQHICNQRRG